MSHYINLHELSILYLGTAVALLISAFLNETVATRYAVGCFMLFISIVLFIAA